MIPSGDVLQLAEPPVESRVDDLQPTSTSGGWRDDLRPQDDAADWQEVTDPDRRGWVRYDVADDGTLDLLPCLTCGGLERWQDLAGNWHCEACSPRVAGPRMMARAAELRTRYRKAP